MEREISSDSEMKENRKYPHIFGMEMWHDLPDEQRRELNEKYDRPRFNVDGLEELLALCPICDPGLQEDGFYPNQAELSWYYHITINRNHARILVDYFANHLNCEALLAIECLQITQDYIRHVIQVRKKPNFGGLLEEILETKRTEKWKEEQNAKKEDFRPSWGLR
ncbi:MAG: hypothetical protein PVJ09_03790 [Candidatus Woesebacteria bacterium]|jgi:hypothetical protein